MSNGKLLERRVKSELEFIVLPFLLSHLLLIILLNSHLKVVFLDYV